MSILSEIMLLTKQLIAIESTPEQPAKLAQALDLVLENLTEFTIEKFGGKGSPSALVYNRSSRPPVFEIILNGHLDVIPGPHSKYSAQVIGNRLYGVGAMDMKASVACLVLAFKETASKVEYPLALQLVTDEQTGSLNGTKYQLGQGVKANFVIAGEATNLDIVNQAKGVLWVRVLARGKSAHGAYPWQAENPIWRMNHFLNMLAVAFPTPKVQTSRTTVSVSNIKTDNVAVNKSPTHCEVTLDIRYSPKKNEREVVLAKLTTLLGSDLELKIVFDEPPMDTNSKNTHLRKLQQVAGKYLGRKSNLYCANGTSDVAYYSQMGCPGVEFGPVGKVGNTHDEHVDIPSLEQYYHILVDFYWKLMRKSILSNLRREPVSVAKLILLK